MSWLVYPENGVAVAECDFCGIHTNEVPDKGFSQSRDGRTHICDRCVEEFHEKLMTEEESE